MSLVRRPGISSNDLEKFSSRPIPDFLTCKKQKHQAREAQIEAALERVRSRSMGMQKTDELKEIIQVIYDTNGSFKYPG